ncbi:hypothetical protein [Caballeronia zhejiangensis]|uniref:hypothetical protein n=1 Tax=Caballeronia zhejiangensis TaxID=871203 RepID=UPI00136492A4
MTRLEAWRIDGGEGWLIRWFHFARGGARPNTRQHGFEITNQGRQIMHFSL